MCLFYSKASSLTSQWRNQSCQHSFWVYHLPVFVLQEHTEAQPRARSPVLVLHRCPGKLQPLPSPTGGGKRSGSMRDAHTWLFRDSSSASALIWKQRVCVAMVLRDQCCGSELSCILAGQSRGRTGHVGAQAVGSCPRGRCSDTKYMVLQFAVWQTREKPKKQKKKKRKAPGRVLLILDLS